MSKEEIRNAAMKAANEYGYDWVMAGYEYEDGDVMLKEFKKEMKTDGAVAVSIYDGEEPYYALDRVSDDDVDFVEMMEDGEVFSEGEVYDWITLGRIQAWKELLRRKTKKVGYFCDGYQAYVFLPEMQNVYMLKQRGEVMMA